jgi:hypothetical protein
LGASCRFAAGPGYRFNSSTLPPAKPAVFPLLSLALLKNGIHAIFEL